MIPRRLRLSCSSAAQFVIGNKLGLFEGPRHLRTLVSVPSIKSTVSIYARERCWEVYQKVMEVTKDHHKRPKRSPKQSLSSCLPSCGWSRSFGLLIVSGASVRLKPTGSSFGSSSSQSAVEKCEWHVGACPGGKKRLNEMVLAADTLCRSPGQTQDVIRNILRLVRGSVLCVRVASLYDLWH